MVIAAFNISLTVGVRRWAYLSLFKPLYAITEGLGREKCLIYFLKDIIEVIHQESPKLYLSCGFKIDSILWCGVKINVSIVIYRTRRIRPWRKSLQGIILWQIHFIRYIAVAFSFHCSVCGEYDKNISMHGVFRRISPVPVVLFCDFPFSDKRFCSWLIVFFAIVIAAAWR